MKTTIEIAECAWNALQMFRTHAAEEGAKQHWHWLTYEEQQQFAVGVERVLNTAEADAKWCHDDWCSRKRAEGYEQGPTNDERFTLQEDGPHFIKVPRTPTHAALLPWDALTETQRAAAQVFFATITGVRDTRGKAELQKGTKP